MRRVIASIGATIGLLLADGCAPPAPPAAPLAALPIIEVHRSPTCSCCAEYEDYLRAEGFTVPEVIRDDVADLKAELGLPDDLRSCHTALVDGYFVEGHVPVEVIHALLEERRAVDGIALPGMPPGSPGMPGVKDEAWSIYSVTDGQATEYTAY